jgi:hypothetical protein
MVQVDLSRALSTPVECSAPAPMRAEDPDVNQNENNLFLTAGSIGDKSGASVIPAITEGSNPEERYVTGRKLAVIFSCVPFNTRR